MLFTNASFFILVIFCYLKKLKFEKYFPIFGLAFLTFIYPATLFATNFAMEAAMAFFVLFVAEAFDSALIRKNIVRIICSMFLLTSYESAIGLFGIMAIICAIRPSPLKIWQRKDIYLYLTFFLAKLLLNIHTISNAPGSVLFNMTEGFESIFHITRSPFHFLSYFIFLVFPLSLLKRQKAFVAISVLLLIATYIYFIFKAPAYHGFYFNEGQVFRSLVIPFSGIFILLSFYFFILKKRPFHYIFQTFILPSCLLALFIEFKTTKDWYNSISLFKKIIKEKKGCYVLPRDNNKTYSFTSFYDVFFGQMSIILAPRRIIDTIILPQEGMLAFERINNCDNFNEVNDAYLLLTYNSQGQTPYHFHLNNSLMRSFSFKPKRVPLLLTRAKQDCRYIRQITYNEDPLKISTEKLSPGHYKIYMTLSGVQTVDILNQIEASFEGKNIATFDLKSSQEIQFEIDIKRKSPMIYLQQKNLEPFQNTIDRMPPYFGINCLYAKKL